MDCIARASFAHTHAHAHTPRPNCWLFFDHSGRQQIPRPLTTNLAACCVRKLGKGGSDVGSITETFRWNPVGNQSHPVELAGSRKRVLRGSGVTPAAKRRQRVRRPCYRAPKERLSWEPSLSG